MRDIPLGAAEAADRRAPRLPIQGSEPNASRVARVNVNNRSDEKKEKGTPEKSQNDAAF